MSQKENIFCFNHIDKRKTKEEIQEIKELYKYYHFKFWVDQKAYKHFKKLNLLLNTISSSLIVVGAVAGGLTANPAILGSTSGAGLVLKTFSETKDYKKKIELSKFCYTTYSKVLVELRTSLRGAIFDKDDFLKEMTVLDEIIVDFAPLVTRFEKQYAKMFLSHPRENVKQNGGDFETTTSSPGPRSMSKIYFRLGAFPLLPV